MTDVISFIYPGFGDRPGVDGKVINEHKMLRESPPRYPGHVTHLYELPAIQDGKIVFDGKYTVESGWDDNNPETMERYRAFAEHIGINTLVFNLYGGISADGSEGSLQMTQPIENYLQLIREDPHGKSKFSPMICLTLPRVDLPVSLSGDKANFNRHRFVSDQSFLYMVDQIFSRYYRESPTDFYHVEDRPLVFLFDYPKMGIMGWHGITVDSVNRNIDQARHFITKRYGTNPLFVSILNDLPQIVAANNVDIDMISNYIDLPYFEQRNSWPIQSYGDLVEARVAEWDQIDRLSKKSYVPAVLTGFDASSRVVPDEYGKRISELPYESGEWYPLIPHVPKTPETLKHYGHYLRQALIRTLSRRLPFINVGPLNELTEQAALLPYYTADDAGRKTDIIEELKSQLSTLPRE